MAKAGSKQPMGARLSNFEIACLFKSSLGHVFERSGGASPGVSTFMTTYFGPTERFIAASGRPRVQKWSCSLAKNSLPKSFLEMEVKVFYSFYEKSGT